jgi:hypothetical protein
MSPAFLIVAVLGLIGSLVLVLVFGRSARRLSHRIEAGERVAKKARFGFGHQEIPLEQRERTLKICPDCREMVFLEAKACRYCGNSLEVTAVKEPDLVLREPRGTRSGDDRKKALPQSLHFPRPPNEPR